MRAVLNALSAIRRRFLLVLMVFVLFLGAAMAGVYLKRPSYESVAKVLVNFEGRGVSLSRSDVQYNTTQLQAVEAVTSQAEILRSHDLIVQVVDQLGPEAFKEPPPEGLMKIVVDIVQAASAVVDKWLLAARLIEPVNPRDALIAAVEKNVQALPVRQAQVIAVSFRWRNPRVPPLVLNKLIELYQAKVGDLNGQADGYDLFLSQATRARQELDKAENEKAELGRRFKVVDLNREKAFLQERIEKLAPVAEAASGRGAAAVQPAAVQGGTDQDASVVGGQIAQLRTQLSNLKVARARLLNTFAAGAREVREIDGQIAEVERALSRESQSVAGALAGYRARLQTLQGAETEFNRLTRNVDIATDAYQTYRKATEDRRVMKEQEVKVRIQTIDPPTQPVGQTGPSRLSLALAAVIGALVLALLFGLLVDWAARERGRAKLEAA